VSLIIIAVITVTVITNVTPSRVSGRAGLDRVTEAVAWSRVTEHAASLMTTDKPEMDGHRRTCRLALICRLCFLLVRLFRVLSFIQYTAVCSIGV